MSKLSLFGKYEKDLEGLFPQNGNYTFLVGAGVSMNPPTSLPSALTRRRRLSQTSKTVFSPNKSRALKLSARSSSPRLAPGSYSMI